MNVYSAFLQLLDSPQFSVPIVHVTGTRGKGSFVAMLEAILLESGLKTGATVSPHLVEVRERIRIAGQSISREDFATAYSILRPIADEQMSGSNFRTVFELLIALAFVAFREHKVDVGIVEVGMGGKLDATNVVNPLISAITKIGLDHTHILGNTLAEIAFDKGHIIKPDKPCIIGVQEDEARLVLERRAKDVNSEMWRIGHEISYTVNSISSWGTIFDVSTPARTHSDLYTPLLGEHQAENATVAVAAADRLNADGVFNISSDQLRNGLAKTDWSGRAEILNEDPTLIIDGAHTPQGAKALAKTLDQCWPDTPYIMLLGINKDKDADGFLDCFTRKPEIIIGTAAMTPRAMLPEEVAALGVRHDIPTEYAPLEEAYKRAIELADEKTIIVATGSLYLVGAIRRLWLHQ
jgi:dihydrofolate synthase / folylpolyglutamate synthase